MLDDLEITLDLNVSTFIKKLVNKQIKVNLNDCVVHIKNAVIDSIKVDIKNNSESTLNNVEQKPAQPLITVVPEKNYTRQAKLVGKKENAKNPTITISHYRFREKMGLINRSDIKNFKLSNLMNYFTPDIMPKDVIDELAEINVTKLGQLTGMGIVGLKYKLTQKYGMPPDDKFLYRMVNHIRQTFDYIGLKFSNKHPHNENEDGTPRKNNEAI